MALTRPSRSSIITAIKGDIEALVPNTDLSLPNSVLGTIATALGGATHELFGRIAWLAIQLFPDICDGEFLERWTTIWGINRNPPISASGFVECTGTDGVNVPAGTVIIRADGAEYTVDALATILSGTAELSITAIEAGEDGNVDAGSELSFQTPISQVDTIVTVGAAGIIGGVDIETDESLRNRLLERIKEPPQGGASIDYPKWAKEVSGVTRAWCHPLFDPTGGAGYGHVSLSFVMDDKDTYPNLIFNGDFSEDTDDWDIEQDAYGGWSYDSINQEVDCDGNQQSPVHVLQSINLIQNRTYKLSYTIKNYQNGTIWPLLNTQSGTVQSSNIEIVDESITAPSSGGFISFLCDSSFQGTIDNIVLKDETSSIIPDVTNIEAVDKYVGGDPDMNYIDGKRPVCAHLHMMRLNAVKVNFTIVLNEYTGALDDVKAAITAELEDLIYREGYPGNSIYLSHIREAISTATGEVDHTLSSPSSDVAIGVTDIGVMGTITWS